jgi:hypothetical protein
MMIMFCVSYYCRSSTDVTEAEYIYIYLYISRKKIERRREQSVDRLLDAIIV